MADFISASKDYGEKRVIALFTGKIPDEKEAKEYLEKVYADSLFYNIEIAPEEDYKGLKNFGSVTADWHARTE